MFSYRPFSIIRHPSTLIFHFIISIIFISNTARANDSLLVQQLIGRIYTAQVQHEPYFRQGLFPSYRMYYYNRGTLKKDDNSFFTGLIVFTLRTLRPYLDTTSRRLCDSVIAEAIPVFEKFRNPRGRYLYSFWQTRPVKYFPNSGLLSLCKANALPDDADCTAICLLATDVRKTVAGEVHHYLQGFTNNKRHKVRSTYRNYKKLPVYSTWLSSKVPVDFDVCVLTNILYMVHYYRLPYTAADSASLQLICRVVQEKQHFSDAAFVSPYYNRPSVILYHLSRLMSLASIPQLEEHRQQLIDEAKQEYAKAGDFYEKVVLSTALLRWGVKLPEQQIPAAVTGSADNRFIFFVANMASMLPNPINRWLTKSGIGRFDYYCPAYNDLLLLENLVWREKIKK